MAETIKTLHLDNCIARIHIPELTEEQKRRQSNRLKAATEKFMCEVQKMKLQSKSAY